MVFSFSCAQNGFVSGKKRKKKILTSITHDLIKGHFIVLVMQLRSTKLKRKKLDIVFHRLLAIANFQLGDVWLQVKKHYDTLDMPQMLLEKLHKLVLVHVDDEQKLKGLKIWNSRAPRKKEEGFTTHTMSDKEFDTNLHKATYWFHVV